MSVSIALDWEPTDIGYLPTTQPGLRTLIVGAGEAGRALVRDLRHIDSFGLAPIGFLDDNPTRQVVRRLPVLGTLDDLLAVVTAQRAEVVILAIPGLPWATVRQLATAASRVGASVRHLPSFVAMLQRDVVGTDLRDLQVGSLIGRDEMHVVSPGVAETLRGKRVLITGAGGSIGSELCRQVHGFEPSQLMMLDHDESNLHRLQLELFGEALLDTDDLIVADIRDRERVNQVMRDYRPEIVFHAAALKHLPMLERHPCEGVKSNVKGTENIVQAAIENDVERFVLISTDKAADPTSILGATKQLAELVMKSFDGTSTIVSAVRFGNVLGSRGSLLTILAEQLRNGEAVTVTHPDVTRYFMTIEEAVGLVLEAARMATGGETFVLDMGKPVRIVDLVNSFALHMQRQSVDIRYTGLRPGEKLHEALFSLAERCDPTDHPRIYSTQKAVLADGFGDLLTSLYAAADHNSRTEVWDLLPRLLPNYTCSAGATAMSSVGPYPDDY
ncbi:MAG: nucleoside-diphosphate sugar epimerase/dehydratase [Actinomycetota bacterium]